MKHFTLFSLVVLICFSSSCKKDQPQSPAPAPTPTTYPEWVTYSTTNSALPNDQVNAITVSKDNVKWVATAGGLASLTGDQWNIYNKVNTALPSDMIQAVAVENDGSVWVGTDNGLARLHNKQWSVYTMSNSILPNNNIKCITHDAAHNTTWIATDDGIVKVSDGKWDNIEEYNVKLSLTTDRDGALWAGVFNDFAFIAMIKKYANGRWTTYRLDQMGYTSAIPYDIEIGRDNNPVAVLGGTVVKAAIKFNGTSWDELTRPEQARGLRTMVVNDDAVWVGGATFSRFGDKKAPLISLPGTDSPILSMALDNNGRKWLGTYYGGVVVYNPKM